MLNIILYEPEIAPNTGNIIRLCANIGANLHLIEPMGFRIDNAKLKRAGLDYHEYAAMQVHASFDACKAALPDSRIFLFTTKAQTRHDHAAYQAGDALMFGPETRGLPESVLAQYPAEQKIRLPMRPQSRSLNLANTVAIASYEAWRQLGFVGARNVDE